MKTTDLSKYNNDWYKITIGASRLKQFMWYFCNILFLKSSWFPISTFKVFILRAFGAKVGEGVVIKPCVNIKYPWKLTVGNYAWIGENVWIDNLAQVSIGNHVCISQGALLLTGNHNFSKNAFDLMVSPIILEEGVWIGAKSVVCPGITAHTHAVLTVQSVATSNLEGYSIYQGNPAKFIKTRSID